MKSTTVRQELSWDKLEEIIETIEFVTAVRDVARESDLQLVSSLTVSLAHANQLDLYLDLDLDS